MEHNEFQQLLQQADASAPQPVSANSANLAKHVIHRARQRRNGTAAALLLMGISLLAGLHLWTNKQHQQHLMTMEQQIAELKTETQEALALVQKTLNQQRQADRLARLEIQLAQMTDPFEGVNESGEAAAKQLVLQADRLMNMPRLKRNAVQMYKDCIRLYSDSPWADEAQQRLDKLKNDEYFKRLI